jgi:hypothetical protein
MRAAALDSALRNQVPRGLRHAERGAWPQPNPHGVYVDDKRYVTLGYAGQHVSARVHCLQLGAKRWAWGYEYNIGPWEYGSGGPSLKNVVSSDDKAILAGATLVIRHLAPAAAGVRGHGYSPEVRRHASRAIEDMLMQMSDPLRQPVVSAALAGAARG